MNSPHQRDRSGLARLADIGPAWITAFATLIVALTGAGYFVGRTTASVTAPPATTPQAVRSISPVTGGVGTTPSLGVGESAGPPASVTPSVIPGDSDKPGTPIGTPYKVTVSVDFILRFEPQPAKPEPPDCSADFGLFAGPCVMGGVVYSGDSKVSRPAITTPTYEACINDTLYVPDPHDMGIPQAGDVFCLLAADGIEVGIVVLDAENNHAGNYMALMIYEWKTDQSS